ncbi:Alcohol oxidase [Mycena indigotica]|uniref:Alcohol oxidase n=1 Tax=Mycena indigotica TaxID=2126181 RepID=A0A8H6SPT8_9AGAR|nr:Alcohol oxidase [Mycena indigotica]KAF7303785.1 Alcohol oxidase [Mycena indigotica]
MQLGPFLLLIAAAAAANGLLITDDPSIVVDKSFDYIVVGGGTAGLTVASRLAEDSGVTILVVEAGTDEQNNTAVNEPSQWTSLLGSPLSWNYMTTPQLGGKTVSFDAGLVLGGSSSINGMQYARGTRDQYDAIGKLGNSGWDWNSMLPYMKKAENFHAPSAEQVKQGATYQPTVHGTEGPLSVAFPTPYFGASAFQTFLQTARDVIPGLHPNLDLSSGHPNGGNSLYFTIFPGNASIPGGNRRCSSAQAYIYPARSEKRGLTILTGHQVTRISWKTAGRFQTASQIEFTPTPSINGTTSRLYAATVKKELIVAAGVFGTPHLLELSGVGNKTILEGVGVTPVIDLPSVGTNLQDPTVLVMALSPNASVSDSLKTINEPGTGSNNMLDISQVLGVDGAKAAVKELRDTVTARAQAQVGAGAFTSVKGLKAILSYQADSISSQKAPVVEQTYAAAPDGSFIAIVHFTLIPQSRGTVHISSGNPAVRSKIDPNFLANNLDLYLLANATKLSRKITQTPPFASLVGSETSPGLASVPINATDSDWQAFVIQQYSSVLNPIGTVSMLPRDMGGAVDSQLFVYGTSNVRVVDASIIPIPLSTGHETATVYGIAEKAADMIKAARK